ncbi:DUF3127 domain-containing protein [Luteolibacter pohnpeiensis]|uniref:DUF3127 domain-containing protein n=1 Tax=Luteolibacter pohnpeiensis TaxID=454153 RepID=A0A934VS78_9BACT|nr:DUF3127 domain-containing protein [Luteolibacter pohnpeiensis]MBK1884001.1 DUF3127 domain-containing protein [Luteolibacter pohnpeiensis]
MYEVVGKIKLINETQSFPSGFTKREFVVTTAHDKYPQDLKFEVVKDKCSMLDQFEPEQDVQVNFDIRGNEYNGRYYVNLACWKIQPADGGASGGSGRDEYSQEPPMRQRPAPSSQAEPSAAELRNEDDFDDDDIPF